MSETRERFYEKDDFSSLDQLELRCEVHESRLTSKLIRLSSATNDDTKGTGAIYERVEGGRLGHLIFEPYENENDENLKKTGIEASNRGTFLFKGTVTLQNTDLKVLVFREK